jgi:hypothetical protein
VSYPVYTERFLATRVTGALVAYQVPEDKRIIVRTISIANEGAGEGKAYAAIHGYTVMIATLPAGTSLTYTSLTLPAYERETIGVFLTYPGMQAIMAGHIFDDKGPGNPPVPIIREGPQPMPVDARLGPGN